MNILISKIWNQIDNYQHHNYMMKLYEDYMNIKHH
jgi:hypothetical protein